MALDKSLGATQIIRHPSLGTIDMYIKIYDNLARYLALDSVDKVNN